MSLVLSISALFILFYTFVDAIPTIATKGQKFFTSTGDQWFIRGVVYQSSSGIGSLDSSSQCTIDAAQISALGANTIRLHHVEAQDAYDECMKAFEEAGIYVLVSLSDDGDFSLGTQNWTTNLRSEYMKKVDVFQKYDNTLGFLIGDYAIEDTQDSAVAPYVKAAISDMKLYRDRMQYRKVPIGYAMSDVAAIRSTVQDYLDCDSNSAGTIDFYSVDTFTWCATNTMEGAGYQDIYEQASDFDVPYFISATGCNQLRPRTFDNLQAIFGPSMSDHISGAVIKQWHEDSEQFGLATYSDSAATGTPTLLADYTSLSSQWAALPTTALKEDAYTATYAKRACPTAQDGVWAVDAAAALPTLGVFGLPEVSAPQSSTAGQPEATESGTPGGSSGSGVSGAGIGVIIGFVLACIFFVSVAGVSIWMCCRCRRKRKQKKNNIELGRVSDKAVALQSTDSLPQGWSTRAHPSAFELPSREIPGVEMPATPDPSEADATPREMTSNPTWPLAVSPFDDMYVESVQRPGTAASTISNHSMDPALLSKVIKKQKKMEVDYLASEEAKLRQRREQLISQSQDQ